MLSYINVMLSYEIEIVQLMIQKSFFYFITYLVLFLSISICAKYKSVLPYITGTYGTELPPPFLTFYLHLYFQ